jgi:rod shape-determining protein MreC
MNGFIRKYRAAFFLLLVFTILFWLITIQVKQGRLTLLERPVLAVSGFFERIVTGAYDAVGAVGRGYDFLAHTHEENRRLADENDRLRIENAVANELLAENNRLRELLDFRKLTPLHSFAAQIVGREISPISSTLTLNKGTDDGIRRDMAVITASGVVGKVRAVASGTATVILLTDPGNTLAVRVQRNREEGLLEGKIVNCALKYVSYYADIQEGDLLVTSGLDGIFPKGLAVATIVKVVKQESNSFQSVYAEPVVRSSRIEEVLVLLP